MGEPLRAEEAPGFDVTLTHSQVAILQWVADGKTNVEIALLMNIERPQLVQRRMQEIMDATGTASRSAAVAWAIRRGVIK